MQLILHLERHAILVPPGFGTLLATDHGAICFIALQELPERSPADERRAGTSVIRALTANQRGPEHVT